MDGAGSQKGSTSSRAPSRSSTSSSHTHRYHHTHCGSGSTTTPPVSSFLIERLQRRQAERSSQDDLSVSTSDTRDPDRNSQSLPVQPTRRNTMDKRYQSNAGEEEGKNGMGVKEMEKAVSTLHKQNFDLKLELYHRRERQTTLEEKTRKLEVQQEEMNSIHESLLSELEKRDKAVDEAVDMINTLEARIDELVREREMVRIVDALGPYHQDLSSPPHDDEAQTLDVISIARRRDKGKTLDRMPSFLSEQSERTANLRNVVLGNRSSLLHMRNVSESSADPSEINRITSPSLSVLSESSFMSVYGTTNNAQDKSSSSSQQDQRLPNETFDGSPAPEKKPSNENWGTKKSSDIPSRTHREASKGGASLFTQMQSLNNILDVASPLQQLEMLPKKLSVDDSSRPSTSGHGRGVNTPSPGRARVAPQVKTSREKREALRNVITASPTAKDLANSHALPPTPDTISSSTLRRYQNSNDTLSREPRITPQDSFISENPGRCAPGYAPHLSPSVSGNAFCQLASTTAFSSRKNIPIPDPNADMFVNFSHLAQSLPQRPRSAGETTTSRNRANSWGSESDSDGGADAHSEDSNFDHWMRESAQPAKRSGKNRSASPDLFSFPVDSAGWETDALFGAMRGSGFLGSPVSALKRDPMDEVAGSLTTPQTAVFQPPAPYMPDGGVQPPSRRSSLHARTGSSNAAVPPVGGKLRKTPVRRDNAKRLPGRARSNSIDSAHVVPPPKMQLEIQTDGAGGAKKNPYPPISGQPAGSRGLRNLFRRSGSQDHGVPSSATDSYFPPDQVQLPNPRLRQPKAPGRSSVPPPATMPWRAPPATEDDLTSATPPPIMRHRGPQASSQLGTDGGEMLGPATPRADKSHALDVSTPDTVTGPGLAESDGTPQSAGKRKWLGLGRMSSSRNRAG
ncbi:hypothetical protein BJ170DRAFT_600029 [Xylariales sp. AK1849]|nr:hypothetical protein BJ170DRAFT_600029 [Xylariales sp. AK1849]